MLWRVKSGEPLQYVLGKWDFYESEFFVGKGVLIPRPETEELVDMAVKYINSLGKCVVYDLCAGSGCIGVSIAKACPNSYTYMIERSQDALFYLLKNSENVENAEAICNDINCDIDLPCADVIISNPPYIKSDEIKSLQNEVKYEPVEALDGGADGLDFYRIINEKWAPKLNKDGVLFLEIGNDQGEDIEEILTDFKCIKVIKDIYGNNRMVKAVKKD